MAKSDQKLQKLSGRSTMSVQKTFLADDHVLIVDGQYTETYKRLAYKDIEAILICPTKSANVFALIFLLSGIPMALSFPIGGADYLPLFIFGVLLLFFGGALLYGKGSVIFGLKTAVQTVILNGVSSRRKADKVKAKLIAEIEAVQGRLTDEALQGAIYKDADRYGTRVGSWAKNEPVSAPTPELGAAAPPSSAPPPISPTSPAPPEPRTET